MNESRASTGSRASEGSNAFETSARGNISVFICGVATSAALASGLALLLYTGNGLLKTTGLLLGVSIAVLAAGLWAGDDSSASTRIRIIALIVLLVVACAFAAKWTVSEPFRATSYGRSLAVLFILALPAYASGSVFASLRRHLGVSSSVSSGVSSGVSSSVSSSLPVYALAGAAAGLVLSTVVMIPRVDAWGSLFICAAMLVPSAIFPVVTAGSAGLVSIHGGLMRDRVIIITGVGSAGQLGYAIAQMFARAGARIIIVGRTDEVRGLADQIGPREHVLGVRADLTTDPGVADVVAAARQFGRLDALINVAGGLTVIETIEDTTSEKFLHEMSINAETVLLMSRAALPMLRESRGAIVNFASPAGEHAKASLGAYSAAKAAVIALTQSLALEEAAHGVRVNAIAPGMIDTEQNRANATPDTKYVTREQVAEVVMFLASDAGSGVSGETIHVAGSAL